MLRWLVLACWLCACNQIFHIPDVKQSNDACGDGLAKCDPDATCTDTSSGYTCACNTGFTGDGMTCSDVDECAMSPSPCSAHASCTNTPGSFTCACDTGFTGDGTTYCEPMTWQKITAASGFGCGVGSDGGLYCWGINTAGFGDGTTAPHLRPTQIGTATDWVDVVARQLRACGIRSDQSMWCWGWGAMGELGDGMKMTEAVPTQVVTDKPGVGWKQVAIGAQTVCGLHTDGSTACWGLNRENNTTRALPVAVDTNTDWTQIAVGRVVCGLRGTGTLWCWGKSSQGDLGLGTVTDQPTPAQVGTATWKSVSVGSFNNVCAVRSDGALFCWGNNVFGVAELQYGTTPAQIGTANDWSAVSVGYNVILGLRSGGAAYGWGFNDFGEAGLVQSGDYPNPMPLSGTVTGWTDIHLEGASPACGLSGGRAYCWGTVGDGALGNGQQIDYYAPTKIGTDTWSAIAGGPGTCGIRSDGALMCWGMNSTTGVGFGNTDPVWAPTRLGTDTWNGIFGGFTAQAGAAFIGTRSFVPYGWGDNSFGELGFGNTTTPQLSPAPVTTPTGSHWVKLAIGDHTCGIRDDASMYCWGANDTSQLGDGTTTATTAPGAPTAGNWLDVAVAQYGFPGSQTCAIKNNHQLWCWGQDLYPATTIQATPTQVGTGSDWVKISMAALGNQTSAGPTTCALQGDGTLWCWGVWLGDGTLNSSPTPVQVGTDNDWTSVAVGGEICAVKSGGTLWCWANNYILGDGTPPMYDLSNLYLKVTTKPTQIGTDTDWASVTTTNESCAIKRDGSLWCWGSGAAPVPGVVPTPNPL